MERGSTILCTPSWRVYNFDVHSPFLIITCLIHLQALMFKLDILLDCWYLGHANHPIYVSVIHILKFHCLENSTSIFGKCLGRYLHSTSYLYPNGCGVVVLNVLLILFVTYVGL